MFVGVLQADLFIHQSQSLKAKRKVMKSVIQRVKNTFNCSVAEVANNDLWQKGTIGAAVISNDKSNVEQTLDHIVNFIEDLGLAELLNAEKEIVGF